MNVQNFIYIKVVFALPDHLMALMMSWTLVPLLLVAVLVALLVVAGYCWLLLYQQLH